MGIVSQKLRDSAKGQPCTMQVEGICNRDPATTVLAHLPSPVSGVGNKGDDFFAVFACSSCHAALDERRLMKEAPGYCLRALQRTQAYWVQQGLLVIAGDRDPRPRPTSKSLPPRRLYE